MKHFMDMMEDELKPKKPPENQDSPSEEKVAVPGGAPGPRTPEEMNEDPDKVLNEEVEKEMSAEKYSLQGDPKATWEAVTKGATHKITQCMDSMNGKVDDPAAFCNWLAQKVGYEPQ